MAVASAAAAGDSDSDSSFDIYMAAGAAALVAGLLVLDMMSDRDRQEDAGEVAVVDSTGIDWGAVEDSIEPDTAVLGLCCASPGPDSRCPDLLLELQLAADRGIEVYPDLLDLGPSVGDGSALETARAFFGVDLLVVADEEGVALVGQDGIIWQEAGMADPGATAESLMVAVRNYIGS